jgi:hypothetical protein
MQSMTLGKTTYDQVVAQFGPPRGQGTSIKEGITVTTITYAFASGADSLGGGVTSARGAGFHFRDGILIGKQFNSSYASERTDFDDTKVTRIKEGVTTISEVTEMFGPTNSEWSYPLIPGQNDRAAVYLYTETRGTAFNLDTRRKMLVVSYRPDGVVTKVEFGASGRN